MAQEGLKGAWIIGEPDGEALWIAQSLFRSLCRTIGVTEVAPPHLTLEIVYEPLPQPERLAAAINALARQQPPLVVPAIGVFILEGPLLAIEIEATPELLALRHAIAQAVVDIGGVPHEENGNWRPHLTVAPLPVLITSQVVISDLQSIVSQYRFPVQSLIVSLATDQADVFQEMGPFRLEG